MTERNDGGPAFPRAATHVKPDNDRDYLVKGAEGLSLRDHIAIEVLAGIDTWTPAYSPDGASIPNANICSPEGMRARARWAYDQADAMLKERDK